MKSNRSVSFEEEYSHYLVWVLFIIGLIFLGALVFQFRLLINNIRSQQEVVWLMENKMKAQSKAVAEKILAGESMFKRLFSRDGFSAAQYSADTWASSVETFIETARNDYETTFGGSRTAKFSRWNHTKWYFASLLHQMNGVAERFDAVLAWRKDYESNIEEFRLLRQKTEDLTVRMKFLIEEQKGLRPVEDPIVPKHRKHKGADEGRIDNYDAVLGEIAELRVILERLLHAADLEALHDFESNDLPPALGRVDRFIQSLRAEDLKKGMRFLLDELSVVIHGPAGDSDSAVPANGLLGNIKSRIELKNAKAVLVREIAERFGRIQTLRIELINSFDQRIYEFQKDMGRWREFFLYSRLFVSALGAVIILIFAFLIGEKIRRQTFRLRKMAEELYDQRKLAMESVEAKSNFMANMSHEIRTPMNAILGFSDLLSRTELSAEQKKYLDIVKSSGTLLIGIINDILDVSKLESGNIRLEQIEFSLEEVIKDVFKMVVLRIKDRPFDTYVQIADDVPARVIGDPTRLKQVFVNLLGNAVKFTSSGSVGVIVTREMPGMKGEIVLRVVVKDTGIGIPSDKLDAIFEPFTQADESTTRKYGGTGLGLTICRSLVQAMGGKIWVESQVGVGTEFIFMIKLGEVPKAKPLQGLKDDKYAWLAGKTAFIVDDNVIAIKTLVQKCELLGLRVFGVADSGYNALSKLEKLASTRDVVPEIIFCDIMMEGMNGFEFVRRLRQDERYKTVKYIAVTADSKAKVPVVSPEKFNSYVIKPVFWDDLVAALEEAFSSHKADELKASGETQEAGSGARILVVEDTETNIILLEQYFDQFRWKGVYVNSGREAIDFLKKDRQFDLCLMDLQMRDIGGVEATRIIRREISKELPIIALSASVMEKDFQEAMDSGMNGFLNKPIVISQLKETVAKYAVRTVKKSE